MTNIGDMMSWMNTADILPENGEEVRTKIDDEQGCRSDETLKQQGNLWFTPDGAMYVYYRPTHWKPL